MDYVAQWEYASYLIDMDTLDRRMNKAIQEALILSEGVNVSSRLESLNEGIIDVIKGAWNKLVRFIKNTFAKVSNAISSKFVEVQTYLTNNKEIILNRPYKLEGVRMKDYQPKRIAAVHLEQFQFDGMKNMENAAAYMKHYIATYNGDGTDIGAWTKAYFCNGTEDMVDVTALNMTDLYNFCMDWENKTKKDLAADQKAVIDSANNVRNLIAQAEQNAKSEEIAKQKAAEEEKKKQEQQTAGQNTTGSPQGKPAAGEKEGSEGEFTNVSSSFNYSDLYGGIIAVTEKVEVPPQNGSNGSGSSNGSTATTPTPAATKFSSNVGGVNGKAETQDTANAAYNNGKTFDEVNKAVEMYKDVAGGIAGAKLTICEQMFADYYEIIKAHVKMYAGDDQADKTASQVGTDYRQLGLPDPKQVGATAQGNDGNQYVTKRGLSGNLIWALGAPVRAAGKVVNKVRGK